jgi:hypothetical protein
MQEDANDTAEKHKSELAVSSPKRHMSPKSVREFVNERIGTGSRRTPEQRSHEIGG